jgi:hypothetical protein
MAYRKNFDNRIKKRQDEAKVRQENSDKLSLEQKIAKARVGSQEFNRLSLRSQK